MIKNLFKCWNKFLERTYYCKSAMRRIYWSYLFAECGEDFTIYGKPVIYSPELIHIGNHVTINGGCQISPRGKVFIGDYVRMSRGSQITAGQLDTSVWREKEYRNVPHIAEDVFIGEGTWLCINSTVLPGVHINGKGVIVAAGAVVAHDINEDYVLVGGIPAKIIKKLES